jgi:mannitol/fructose-specific phosphotransferase system IIA component (Ntr-type)
MNHTERFQNFVDAMNTRNSVAFESSLESNYELLQAMGENWFAKGLISETVSKTLRRLAGDLEDIRYIRNLDSRKAEFEKWLVQLNAVVLVEQPAEEAEKAEAAAEEIENSAKYVRMDDGTFGVPMLDGYTYPVETIEQMESAFVTVAVETPVASKSVSFTEMIAKREAERAVMNAKFEANRIRRERENSTSRAVRMALELTDALGTYPESFEMNYINIELINHIVNYTVTSFRDKTDRAAYIELTDALSKTDAPLTELRALMSKAREIVGW